MAKLKPLAAGQGYVPDYVTSDQVHSARPTPAMIYLNMVQLDVYPAQAVVKVDDTSSGIIAGCWTVGIAETGNYVGMTEEDMEKADKEELAAKIDKARDILYQAGAHFVIDTTCDLPPIIEEINQRMRLGLRP